MNVVKDFFLVNVIESGEYIYIYNIENKQIE